MSKLFGILILLIQLVLLTFAYESKAAPYCRAIIQTQELESLFSQLRDSNTSLLKPIETTNKFVGPVRPEMLDLKFIEQKNYPHHHMIQKDGISWASKHWLAPFAPIGDISTMVQIFGPKVSQLLGFHQIDSDTILVPKVSLLNQKIKIINQILKIKGIEPIAIRLQEVPADSAFSVKKFILLFATEAALPIAESGAFAFHDISFHLSEIGLPNVLVKYAKDRAQLVMQIDAFMQREGSDADKVAWKKVRGYEASAIDILGNIVAVYLKSPLYKRSYLEPQFNNGSSPLQVLILRMKRYKIHPETIEKFLAELSPQQQQQYRGLLAERMGVEINTDAQPGKTYQEILYDLIEQTMIDRINELRTALQ